MMTADTCTIGPEEVVASYRKTGIPVLRYDWLEMSAFSGDAVGCCGLTAVALARGRVRLSALATCRDIDLVVGRGALSLDPEWQQGFIWGFEGEQMLGLIDNEGRGYACGAAAWRAVVDAGLASD